MRKRLRKRARRAAWAIQAVQLGADLAPILPAMSTENEPSLPRLSSALFSRIATEADVDHLDRPSIRPGHRHGTERPGIAARPTIELSIEHYAATGKSADVEIDDVQIAATARPKLSSAPQADVASFGDKRESPTSRWISPRMSRCSPLVHDVARSADRVGPVPQFERHRDAQARNALFPLGGESWALNAAMALRTKATVASGGGRDRRNAPWHAPCRRNRSKPDPRCGARSSGQGRTHHPD